MFDLEREIGHWRVIFRKAGSIRRDALDELECHLRDDIDHLSASGLSQEEAFHKAVCHIGGSGELSEEFGKVKRWDLGLMEMTVGEVIVVGYRNLCRNEHFITLLLFMGISGVVAWIVTTWWMLSTGTNSGHWATWSMTFQTIGLFSLWSSFFLFFAVVGLPWGGALLRSCENKKRVLARAVIPAIVLSPVYAILGFIAILFGPYLYACGSTMVYGQNVVQSAVSPDGSYEAYVVDWPSIDGPNQSLIIDRADGIHFLSIADLAEDIDFIESIHWSPQSDIVVFETNRNLYAVCLPSDKTVRIYLGKEWRRTSKERGSTYSSGGVRLQVRNIEFPEPGVVSDEIEGASEVQRLEMGSFLR